MLQLKNHALAWCELLQCAGNAAAQFATHQVALRIAARPGIRNVIENVILFSCRIGSHGRVFLANLPFANMIQA